MKITIEFDQPNFKKATDPHLVEFIMRKLDYIIKQVLDDIRDELASINNVLIRNRISYYLDVEEKRSHGAVRDQMLNDLKEMMINYDILIHPSASRLFEMILVTIANIAGFHFEPSKPPAPLFRGIARDYENIRLRLLAFFEKVRDELLSTRPCHAGIRNLIDAFGSNASKVNNAQTFSEFVNTVDSLYQSHGIRRNNVRQHARTFLGTTFYPPENANIKNHFNILLYGYSELTIKALCGIRDYLLGVTHPGTSPKKVYGSSIEDDISKQISIYICEGQPKTHTGTRDRLLYYDGAGYALTLRRRNFHNIILIPDIVVANIFEHIPIDLIMIGANGFDDMSFKHSAGHSSIVQLAREYNARNKNCGPHVVLVVSSEKYTNKYPDCKDVNDEHSDDSTFVEGCRFIHGPIAAGFRNNIWITRDINVIRELNDNNIRFYNPREDVIPIDCVNYIVSNTGFYEIDTGQASRDTIKSNINKFLLSIKSDIDTMKGFK
jgi:hypothetical protein